MCGDSPEHTSALHALRVGRLCLETAGVQALHIPVVSRVVNRTCSSVVHALLKFISLFIIATFPVRRIGCAVYKLPAFACSKEGLGCFFSLSCSLQWNRRFYCFKQAVYFYAFCN